MITVFTPYFAARTPERQAELDLCLARNLACGAIDRLVLLIDDGHLPPHSDPKLEVRHIQGRPTYRQWIELSGELPPGGLSVLANSDIHFDETLAKAHETLSAPERFLALSRFEQVGDRLEPHPNPRWSQDVWGLRTGQALPSSFLKSLDIPLGVPRCDNKIAYLFAVHGWTVHNPMQAIRSVHVHETQQRHYDKKADLTVMGGVAYVNPTSGLQETSELDIDVWARNVGLIRSVKINHSLDDWLGQADLAPRIGRVDGAPSSDSDSNCAMAAPVGNFGLIARAIREGDELFAFRGRFRVYRLESRLMAVDRLNPALAQWVPLRSLPSPLDEQSALQLLKAFVPPVIDTTPIRVRQRPKNGTDCHFWQYPAATERQAFENHLNIPPGTNIDVPAKVVHTYIGLPWATYIDKKNLPEDLVRQVAPCIAGLRDLASDLGTELRVHTVCQQIHWRRLIDVIQTIGLTDLHLSHAERDLAPHREGWNLRIHSWPLFAPNVELPERTSGLVIGKPISKRRYLASFIGAHMPHYRSNIRLQLEELSRSAGRNDILIDLGNEWHFNKVVYSEQVQGKTVPQSDMSRLERATSRYNEILSDSIFSLCPEGAGPNTLRLWESLAVGAIPVIISDQWLPPVNTLDGVTLNDCCLYLKSSHIDQLLPTILSLQTDQLLRMQTNAMAYYRSMRNLTAYLWSTPT